MRREPSGSGPIAPYLLLVGGAPASGKTQLARELAARYHAALCGKDEIKEILFATLEKPGAEVAEAARWSRRLSDASFALLFHVAATLLRWQRCVVLEGNFRPGEHEAPLAALLSASGARAVQILCQASSATRAVRLSARATDPMRHAAHRDAQIDAQRPAPDFLALPGPRLLFSSEPGKPAEPGCPGQDALAALCAQLEAHLAGAGAGDCAVL